MMRLYKRLNSGTCLVATHLIGSQLIHANKYKNNGISHQMDIILTISIIRLECGGGSKSSSLFIIIITRQL